MAGKQAMRATKFDPKLFDKQVQKFRNERKKAFLDHVARSAKTHASALEKLSKAKSPDQKAIEQAVAAAKRDLEKGKKDAERGRQLTGDEIRKQIDDLMRAYDDKDRKPAIRVRDKAERGMERDTDETIESVKRLGYVLKEFRKVHGDAAVEVLAPIIAILITTIFWGKRKR